MRAGFTCLFLLGGSLYPLCAQSVPAVRDADAACGSCHQKIFSSYLKTPMANASGAAADRAVTGSFRHTASGVEYQVTSETDGPHLHYRLPDSLAASVKLDYFLGSGHLGTTYLYSINHFLFESPIAYYRNLNAYDMKPGLEKSPTMPPALALNDACVRCHMSAVQRPDPGTDNRYSALPFLQAGITCESCHGDTRQHVATRGASSLIKIARLTPERRDSICVNCHLEGDTNVARRGRSVLDFKPGEDVDTYLDYFVYAGANTTVRAVSEIEQFNISRCKIASGPAMSCVTCHDPHSSPEPAERAAYFRTRCLTCHQSPKYTAHYAQTPDCTGCHMPKNGAQNIAHVAWTDHRIRKLPEPPGEGQPPQPAGSLQPILAHDNSQRDLGLAYYNLVIKGKVAEKDRALSMLLAADRAGPGDVAVLRALGVLSEMNHQDADAEQYYRAILKVDPANLTASANLGVLLAKNGNVRQAATLWEATFLGNQDIVDLGTNLATAHCMLGEKDQAENTLRQVLTYSPDLRRIRGRLAAIEGSRECEKPSGPAR